jgi:serine/threonine-protein kinase
MSFFANYRADRLIAEVKSSGNPGSPESQKALDKLVGLGPNAIEPIVAALSTAEKRETLAFVDALSKLIDAKSLPQLLRTMADSNGRAISGISWALSTSRNYPPAALLDALGKPDMPKAAIIDVIAAQKTRYTVRDLLKTAYTQDASERAGLFKIVGEIADETSLDDLIARIEGKDPVARLHIINVLGRFNTPKVQQAIQKQLKDNSKFIRSAALSALSRMDGPFDMALLCAMLRDPEIEVQNKAVDVVIKANHPDTVKYLVDVLKDENEYARRAAVEVLNVVGTSK